MRNVQGPVHPPIANILNPWVQPYTSKPWGYAAAPGHPYEAEWWNVVEKTAWKGWRHSEEHRKICDEAKARCVEEGMTELEKRLEVARQV